MLSSVNMHFLFYSGTSITSTGPSRTEERRKWCQLNGFARAWYHHAGLRSLHGLIYTIGDMYRLCEVHRGRHKQH